MDYIVGTNFDNELIKRLGEIDTDKRIKSFYGAVTSSPSGGGISHGIYNDNKTLEDIAGHIALIKSLGYEFSYVFNNTCYGNNELSSPFWQELKQFLGFLLSIGVKHLTIASPFLIDKVKKNFGTSFHIKASITILTDSLRKIQHLRSLGIEGVVLDDQVNRDFELLKLILKTSDLETVLLANQNCIYGCPYRHFHKSFLSHYSKTESHQLDYHYLLCSLATVEDPENLLSARWIRPEDQSFYEDIGVKTLKIGMRSYPTEVIIKAATAYLNHSYNGNLLDILYGNYAHSLQIPGTLLKSSEFSQIFSTKRDLSAIDDNTLYYTQFNLPAYFYYVDNSRLSGFIDHFTRHDCKKTTCHACGHCHDYTKKAVQVTDENKKNMYINLLSQIREYVAANFNE